LEGDLGGVHDVFGPEDVREELHVCFLGVVHQVLVLLDEHRGKFVQLLSLLAVQHALVDRLPQEIAPKPTDYVFGLGGVQNLDQREVL